MALSLCADALSFCFCSIDVVADALCPSSCTMMSWKYRRFKSKTSTPIPPTNDTKDAVSELEEAVPTDLHSDSATSPPTEPPSDLH